MVSAVCTTGSLSFFWFRTKHQVVDIGGSELRSEFLSEFSFVDMLKIFEFFNSKHLIQVQDNMDNADKTGWHFEEFEVVALLVMTIAFEVSGKYIK